MTALIERLRAIADALLAEKRTSGAVVNEAADEIERLQGACQSYEQQANRDAVELERLRRELRKPKGCTYDAEGRPLTICSELATLRELLRRLLREARDLGLRPT